VRTYLQEQTKSDVKRRNSWVRQYLAKYNSKQRIFLRKWARKFFSRPQILHIQALSDFTVFRDSVTGQKFEYDEHTCIFL
jgi:hypothetical protein